MRLCLVFLKQLMAYLDMQQEQPAVTLMNAAAEHELVERYGYRETLIGIYPSQEKAEREKAIRLDIYRAMRISHGELIVRRSF